MYVVICCYSLAECVLGTAQLLGFAQSRHALYHLTGNFLNPAPYACLLASAAVLCIVNLLRRGGGRLVRILTLMTLSWSSVMVVIARSRAVWLGMALALICIFARESSVLRRVRHKWIPACVLAIVFIAGCAGAWMLKPESAKARLCYDLTGHQSGYFLSFSEFRKRKASGQRGWYRRYHQTFCICYFHGNCR